MALQLMHRGITKVHPLEGGYDAWKELGYPVVPWEDTQVTLGAPAAAPA